MERTGENDIFYSVPGERNRDEGQWLSLGDQNKLDMVG